MTVKTSYQVGIHQRLSIMLNDDPGDTVIHEHKMVGKLIFTDVGSVVITGERVFAGERITESFAIKGEEEIAYVGIGSAHRRMLFRSGEWDDALIFRQGQSIKYRTYADGVLLEKMTPKGGFFDIVYQVWSGDTFLSENMLEVFIDLGGHPVCFG